MLGSPSQKSNSFCTLLSVRPHCFTALSVPNLTHQVCEECPTALLRFCFLSHRLESNHRRRHGGPKLPRAAADFEVWEAFAPNADCRDAFLHSMYFVAFLKDQSCADEAKSKLVSWWVDLTPARSRPTPCGWRKNFSQRTAHSSTPTHTHPVHQHHHRPARPR